MDDPCGYSDRTWFVTIYNCDGTVLEYCDRRYVLIPAPCGHLEIDVPPGCYLIKAVWSYRAIGTGVFAVNHFTDAAIVTACCEHTTCVKLFNPSAHRCGIIYALAVADLQTQELVDERLAARVDNAVKAVNRKIPKPERLFELGHLDEIDEFIGAQKEG